MLDFATDGHRCTLIGEVDLGISDFGLWIVD